VVLVGVRLAAPILNPILFAIVLALLFLTLFFILGTSISRFGERVGFYTT
jgi:hypothetical protein